MIPSACDSIVKATLWIYVGIGLEIAPTESAIQIYPNPTTSELRITVDDARLADMQWQLYDALGREVLQLTLAAGENLVSVGHLPEGVYMWSVAQLGDAKGKVVVFK